MANHPKFAVNAEAYFELCFEHNGVWYPPLTKPHILDQMKTFEVRENDLLLATYPKCGTHWMMEILLLMQQDGHVDRIKRDPVISTDISFGLPPDFQKAVLDVLDELPSPRFYITHVPSQALPSQVWTKKCKVVYVTRNPKDACASMYRFLSANPLFTEPVAWDRHFEKFMSKKANYGSWFNHALGFWERRNDGHVCFVTFEEMKQDIRLVIRRLEKFLDLTITPEGMERIVMHSSVEGMKKTYAKIEEDLGDRGKMITRAFGIMPFIQKGVCGSWKGHFTDEESERLDKAIKERLSGTGLDLHYH